MLTFPKNGLFGVELLEFRHEAPISFQKVASLAATSKLSEWESPDNNCVTNFDWNGQN